MAAVRIDGPNWKAAAGVIRTADKEIKRQVTRELGHVTRPIVTAMRASVLNSNGGGAGTGLRSRVAGSVKRSRTTTGITIYSSTKGIDGRLAAYMDKGSWRHPVFGNRNKWVTQTTTAQGWFTNTARLALPAAEKGVAVAVNRGLELVAARLDATG